MDFNKNYEASVFETTIRLHYKVYNVFEFNCFRLNEPSYYLLVAYVVLLDLIDTFRCFFLTIFWAPFSLRSRVVGGLLSAYDLSEDKVFLDKAKDIADRLLPAWDTPSGIPYNIINLAQGRPHNPGWTGVSS